MLAADARRVAIAIHPERNLYNGQPSLIATWLQALRIEEAKA